MNERTKSMNEQYYEIRENLHSDWRSLIRSTICSKDKHHTIHSTIQSNYVFFFYAGRRLRMRRNGRLQCWHMLRSLR